MMTVNDDNIYIMMILLIKLTTFIRIYNYNDHRFNQNPKQALSCQYCEVIYMCYDYMYIYIYIYINMRHIRIYTDIVFSVPRALKLLQFKKAATHRQRPYKYEKHIDARDRILRLSPVLHTAI